DARIAVGRNPAIVAAQITRDGVVTAVAGRADSPDGAPLSSSTRFEIGSITKAITGVLFADAIARGEVREDERLVEALPGLVLPEGGAQITLLDLATHRSGLPSFPPGHMPANPRDPWADVDSAAVARSLAGLRALQFTPGSRAEYSNVGAGLLGQVLVRRAGVRDFETLVRTRFAEPLGLGVFAVTESTADRARFAQGHDDDGPSARWHLEYLAAAGAILSTLDDMVRVARACLGDAPSPLAAHIAEAQRPRRDFPPHRVGLHWITTSTPSGDVHWHNGGTGGFRSFLGCNRATGRASVVLTNSTTGVDDLGLHLIDAALPLRPPPARTVAPTVAVAPEVLETLVGTYRLAPTFAITITRDGDGLAAQATNQPKLELLAESATRWRVRGVEAVVEFERDASGQVTALVLVQGGARQRGVRVPR
ncbi:MAG TPA: serine hydrolase, partial [Gemmatimonadaceae bacterium]|nr:serine hydrolase [Gemmatimonadaceae bacterium]